MFKILTRNKIADCGLNELPKEHFNISDNEKSPDGIILRSYVLPEEELTPGLKAIGRAGAGVNNIPVDACAEKGIVVFNTPGANANGVKEIVLAGLLLASRDIVGGINWAQGLVGQTGVAKAVEKGKAEFVGPEISGKRLGVIGLGAIGVLVANVCRSLGMSVVGYDPFISVAGAWSLSRGVHRASDLDSLLAECDYISLHVPVNEDTKGMFNKEMFAKCKKGVRIINSARAELVEDAALLSAIDDGTVYCYVTDFPTENMLGHKRIVPIPHLGASTPESEDNCATMAAAQLREYLMYGNIKNSVNFPNCELPYTGKKRVCVIHRNLPKVINPVTAILAERGSNISNMIMKSKGEYAYVILDVDCPSLDGVEEEIIKIDNIINVRVI
ncbi:MAG: 3-phosphoglycerate dehydrogenase family protein [Defluviitaleaceae bacterium]|nr:3-phosphoglycerate dehydrogenase family protein [Defluviitaleaceae bacterium]